MQIRRVRRRERMIDGDQPMLILAIFEQRKIDYPEKASSALVAQAESVCELEAQLAKRRTHLLPGARHHQQRIARAGASALRGPHSFLLVNMASDRTLPAAVRNLHPCQAEALLLAERFGQ